jgi:hypothetical protein
MGWVFYATSLQLYFRERLSTHFNGGWVGPTADLDQCEKKLLPQGFDSLTAQLVASCYSNYVISAHISRVQCACYL